jgi:aryl-alcohol dehydrogenase-like predicted oxidoreductase
MALPELSVFQVPENICDRRLIASSEIQRLSEEGNSFVVRSIFLQGLLLMNPNSIPKALKSAVVSLQELNYFSRNNSLTVLDLCLAYVRSISWASAIVVGVHSVDQLKEIQGSSYLLPRGWATSISNLPQEIIDPRNWTL